MLVHVGCARVYFSDIFAEFQKAGVRGISILVASGDSGVQAVVSSTAPDYNPDYPASSIFFFFCFVYKFIFMKN